MALAPTPSRTARMIGAIDIGSNAIRMVIGQISAEGHVDHVEDLQRAAPLGQDCFSDGRIKTSTINLAIEVLRGYQQIMEPYNIQVLRAVATSAVREATNADVFVERVFMATGIPVEIITGAEQDRLLYAAVRDAFQSEGMSADEKALIVELGSGSAAIAMFHRGEVIYSGAYPLGTIRLRQAVRPARLSPSETLDLIQRFIGPSIDAIEHNCPLKDTRNFIMVGADARFAADRVAKQAREGTRVRSIEREAFLRFVRTMTKMRPEEIAHEYSLPFQDCETLSPALIAYAELLKRTPAQEALVPDVSMRDGLILDFVAEETGQGLDELERQVFSSSESIGRHYQYDEAHARHVAELACRLFDQLAGEHGLGRRERRLLRVAALLHEAGLYVSNRSHHKHSEYIIANSEMFGVRADERAMVACVARYHRRSPPKPTHPVYMALSRQERATVSKLAAILRVADALDRGHSRKVKGVNVELRPGELILHADTREDLTLERLAMRAKSDMFEEVFGRKTILQG